MATSDNRRSDNATGDIVETGPGALQIVVSVALLDKTLSGDRSEQRVHVVDRVEVRSGLVRRSRGRRHRQHRPDGERIETYTGTAITIVHTLRTLALEGHPLDSLIQRTSEITPA